MNFSIKKFMGFIAVAGILALPLISRAQTAPQDFSIALTQKFSGPAKDFPGPNESYTAEVRGSQVDLDRSTIAWTKNSVVVARGLGIKKYDYTTGAVGSRDTLSVAIIGPNGTRYTISRTITINDVDLLWFADTTAPPWYAGKALASPSSRIHVAAFPDLRRNGAPVPPSQLVYRWKRNTQIISDASGANRQSLAFTADIIPSAETEITLSVTDLSETIGAQKTITVPLTKPVLRFYIENPLEGTRSNTALSQASVANDSTQSFRIVPFFFSKLARLSYAWLVDGKSTDVGTPPDILELAAVAGTRGIATINATIKNTGNILESGSENLTVYVQ